MISDVIYIALIGLLVLSLILSFLGRRKAERQDALRAKRKEDVYRTRITEQIESASGQVEVIVIRVLEKDAQKECQDLTAKMYAQGYKLIQAVPITGSRRIDHGAGDYSMTDTVSIVHYFEKVGNLNVVSDQSEDRC